MVAVVDRNEFTGGVLHRVIDVACLGVIVFVTLDVVNAGSFCKSFNPVATAVVENIDVDFVFGPVKVLGGKNRGLNDFKRFVVSRNEDVDRGPSCAIGRQSLRATVKRPTNLEIAQNHHDEGVGFGCQKQTRQKETDGAVSMNGRGIAPPEVAARNGHRKHKKEHQGDAGLDVGE